MEENPTPPSLPLDEEGTPAEEGVSLKHIATESSSETNSSNKQPSYGSIESVIRCGPSVEEEGSLFSLWCFKRTANFTPLYARYCLFMFCLINLLDQADRWALPTLQASGLQCSSCGTPDEKFYSKCIEECLPISDFQMGILTGPSFSVTALFFTIPWGLLADRYNRVFLLWIALLIWSAATVASGFTDEFFGLLVCRMTLGIGQAAVNPCVYSIIADLFTDNRALFLSFFTSMIYTGQALGLGCGALSQFFGWRIAFFALGVPGLVVSIPFLLTVREPVRGLSDMKGEPTEDVTKSVKSDSEENSLKNQLVIRETELESKKQADSEDIIEIKRTRTMVYEKVKQVLRQTWYIFSYPPFTMLWLSALVRFMAGYAIGGWLQVFYRRIYGVDPAVMAIALAIIVPTSGALSAAVGGWIGDRWAARDPSGKCWLCALSSLLGAVFMTGVLLAPTFQVSLVLLWFEYFFAEMWYAPAGSMALDLSPPATRSYATALYLTSSACGAASSAIVGYLNSVFGKEIPGTSESDEGEVYDPVPALLIMTSGCYAISTILYLITAYLFRIYHEETQKRVQEGPKKE